MQEIIYKKLLDAFEPTHLVVQNKSHLHHGHAGSPHTGNSHFSIEITSPRFKNLSKVLIHRQIYTLLQPEMDIIHALEIDAKA